MKIPSNLKKGDTIGIVCPAGYMEAEKAATCIKVLQKWGFNVEVGFTLGNQFNYFSGSDGERMADLQAMLDNPDIKAILCGRGGYGSSRIVDEIDWKKFRTYPKWIIGFSDITVLHSYVLKRFDIASLHAPMAAAFNEDAGENEYVQSLKNALLGKPMNYTCAPNGANKFGTAKGQLVGGNLSMLIHQLATPSEIKTSTTILFLEDVGEYLYNIDRMMLQLDRAKKLHELAGLVIGGFTDLKDTTIPFGQSIEQIISYHVRKYQFPVSFGFAVSHNKENYALKIGLRHELTVNEKGTRLKLL